MASRRITAISSKGIMPYRDISNILSTCGFWHLVKGSFGDRATLIRRQGPLGTILGMEAKDFEGDSKLFSSSKVATFQLRGQVGHAGHRDLVRR